jgi:beta-glucosidase/6-phospho-beta-glucosidase/beta-galactosidase
MNEKEFEALIEAKIQKGMADVIPKIVEAVKAALKEQETPPPPEKKPEDYTTEDTCKAAGFNYYDGACHKEPKAEEPAPLVEARKEVVDLKAKVADAEKKLNEAKAETLMLAKTIESQIPQDQGLRFFNPAARRVVEDIKRTLLPFKESK